MEGRRGRLGSRTGSAPVAAARKSLRLLHLDGLGGHGRRYIFSAGDPLDRLAGSFEFFFGEDEAADIAQRLLPNGHLLEVILPDGVGGGAGGSTGEGFSFDGDDFAVRVEARVFLRRKEEGDLGSLLPEVAGKLVGEEQGVITAPRREKADGLLKAGPVGFEVGLEPMAKFKPMHAGTKDDDAEEFVACHGSLVERTEVTPCGSTLGRPNGNAEAAFESTGKCVKPLSTLVQAYRCGKGVDMLPYDDAFVNPLPASIRGAREFLAMGSWLSCAILFLS